MLLLIAFFSYVKKYKLLSSENVMLLNDCNSSSIISVTCFYKNIIMINTKLTGTVEQILPRENVYQDYHAKSPTGNHVEIYK